MLGFIIVHDCLDLIFNCAFGKRKMVIRSVCYNRDILSLFSVKTYHQYHNLSLSIHHVSYLTATIHTRDHSWYLLFPLPHIMVPIFTGYGWPLCKLMVLCESIDAAMSWDCHRPLFSFSPPSVTRPCAPYPRDSYLSLAPLPFISSLLPLVFGGGIFYSSHTLTRQSKINF